MPATLEAVQSVPAEGVVGAYINAAADGHLIPINSGRTRVHIKNASGSPVTATFAGGLVTGSGRNLDDRTVTIAAGADKFVSLSRWDDQGGDSAGQALLTFSAQTDVTFALLK